VRERVGERGERREERGEIVLQNRVRDWNTYREREERQDEVENRR
jgi:hypothetical protein